jgi:hypothetical protein
VDELHGDLLRGQVQHMLHHSCAEVVCCWPCNYGQQHAVLMACYCNVAGCNIAVVERVLGVRVCVCGGGGSLALIRGLTSGLQP